jgi:Skp family chaperone for outer membrane proteins
VSTGLNIVNNEDLIMKLNELAVANPTKQAAKVFESYFGKDVNFSNMTSGQARGMLKRVRALIAEHRRTPEFHHSEKSSAYLKLVVMEQALSSVTSATAPATAPVDPQKMAAQQTLQRQQQQRQLDDESKQIDQQIRDLTASKYQIQKQKSMPAMESRLQRNLREASEIQQAQVVLASQDMVDQVQKMIEQVTSMQFKDLPALVDSIKNEVGVDQAQQFNADATAALAGLTQNLKGSKGQLETALGVVTGQAPAVPGADMAPAEMPVPDMGAEELPAPEEDEEEFSDLEVSLGRGKR